MGEGSEDRFVTLRELKRGGIVGTTPGGTVTTPPIYGVQDPTAPTNLAASGALANIILTWDEADYLGHSHTEIWAATTDDFSLKTLVGTAEGTVFSHNIGSSASRYYWARHVNVLGTQGPFNDTAGTFGITGDDPAYLLEVLAGAITDAELSTELNTQIDTNTTQITNVRNLYTVKMDNAGNLSGFGLMSTLADGGVATSDFFISADRFAVSTPNTSLPTRGNTTAYAVGAVVKVASSTSKMLVAKTAGTTGGSAPNIASTAIGALVTDGSVVWQVASRVPLAVTTSALTINGTTFAPGVYIDGASIVNATITNAAIANLAVDNAKIANLAVDNAKIADLAIDSLKIANVLQSTNFDATNGWQINKAGTATFNQVNIRGTIYGGSASSYSAGTGLFAGLDSTVYKFRVGNPAGNRVTWDGSALNIVGTISGSTLTVGTSPAVDGNSMTGSGAVINSTGTFALGTSTGNISFNGSTLTLNGDVVATANIETDAVSSFLGYKQLASFQGIFSTSTPLSYEIGRFTNIPYSGSALVSIVCLFQNFSTGTIYHIQPLVTVGNGSGISYSVINDPPILELGSRGTNSAFLDIGPTPTTSGNGIWTTQNEYVESVTQGQNIVVSIYCPVNANNSTVYLVDAYFTVTLFKR